MYNGDKVSRSKGFRVLKGLQCQQVNKFHSYLNNDSLILQLDCIQYGLIADGWNIIFDVWLFGCCLEYGYVLDRKQSPYPPTNNLLISSVGRSRNSR